MVLHALTESLGLGLLVLLFGTTGDLLERVLPLKVERTAPRRLVLVSLGIVVWIYLIFLIAAVQALYPAVVFAVMGLCLAGYAFLHRRDWRTALRADLRLSLRLTPVTAAFLAAMGFVLLFLFVMALDTRITADDHNYHLFVPKRYLLRHGFYRIPFKTTSNWPLNMEMLFLLAMAVKDFMLAHLMHFLTGGLTMLALYFFCRETSGRFGGLLAAMLYLVNDVVRWILPICYTDLGVAFFFFMSFWFISKSLDEPDREKNHLLIAGVFAGAMAGCKLNAFVGGVVLGVVYLTARLGSGRFWLSVRRLFVCYGIPAVGLLLPWSIKSAVSTGNPVYPFLFGLFGGPEWNDQLTQEFVAAHRNIGMGREPLDYLFLPFRVIWYGQYDFTHFYGIVDKLWIALVPLAALFGIRRPVVRRAMFAALLYFVAWALGTQQMRHLIPVLPLLAAGAAITLAHWIGKIPRRAVVTVLKSVLLLAAAVYLVYVVEQDPSAFGSAKQGQVFLSRPSEELALEQFVNRRLPKKARILNPNVHLGFHLDREIVAHNLMHTNQIKRLLLSERTPDRIYRKLRSKRITHVLVRANRRDDALPPLFEKMLADPLFARPVFRNARFVVFELSPKVESPAVRARVLFGWGPQLLERARLLETVFGGAEQPVPPQCVAARYPLSFACADEEFMRTIQPGVEYLTARWLTDYRRFIWNRD